MMACSDPWLRTLVQEFPHVLHQIVVAALRQFNLDPGTVLPQSPRSRSAFDLSDSNGGANVLPVLQSAIELGAILLEEADSARL